MKQGKFSSFLGRIFGRRTNNFNSTTYSVSTENNIKEASAKPRLFSTAGTASDSTELDDIASSQIMSASGSCYWDREVGHVLWSSVDHLTGTSNVNANYKVTPLHVFKNEPGAGDYYVVEATYTIKNNDMYHAPHTNMHGGVHVRIGGFCLDSVSIKSELVSKSDSSINSKICFASSPKPETDNIEHTYTINDGWSIGGGLTVGIKGGKNCYAKGSGIEGSANANFDFNISHSKSDSYSMNDLNIHNQSDGRVAQFKLNNRNVTHFDWGCDNGISDCSDFAKASLIFHAYWIWYIPNVDDVDTDFDLNIKTTIVPNYKSCRFYSTKADYDEWWDSFTMNGENKLFVPNRTKSSLVEIFNDTDKPISNIRFTKVAKTEQGASTIIPDYSSQSTFAPTQTGKFCLDSGSYLITMLLGDGTTVNYKTNETLNLEDGKTVRLVASFDFK